MVYLYWILPNGNRESQTPQRFSSLSGAKSAAKRFFATKPSDYLRVDIVDPLTGNIVCVVENERPGAATRPKY